MRLLGIDPGKTTGFALIEVSKDASGLIFNVIEEGSISGFGAVNYLTQLTAHKIIIEDFILERRRAHEVAVNDPELLTVRVIGGLMARIPEHLIEWQRNIDKGMCSDNTLRELNLYTGDRHTKDAKRHVVIWARRNLLRIKRVNKGPLT